MTKIRLCRTVHFRLLMHYPARHCICFGQPAASQDLIYITNKKKKKLRGLSPRADYTDTAAAAGRRS